MLKVSYARKKVLFVSRTIPFANYSGAATHTRDVISFLTQNNFDVSYLCLDPRQTMVGRVDTAETCKELFFPSPPPATYPGFDDTVADFEINAFVQALEATQAKIVIVDYAWLADLFDHVDKSSGIKKVIFCHDLRSRILPSLTRMGFNIGVGWPEDKDAALLRKADAAMVLQEEDSQTCKRLVPSIDCIRIGVSVRARYCDVEREVRGRTMYLASNLRENVFALAWMIGRVWPLVRSRVPAASLLVCGSVAQSAPSLVGVVCDSLQALEDSGISFVGRVEDLYDAYCSAGVSLVPHWMEGGIKLKFVEALAHGRAVVGTRCGLDGIPTAIGACALAADESELFAQHIVTVLSDDTLRRKMQGQALKLALERLTPEQCYRDLATYLTEGRS